MGGLRTQVGMSAASRKRAAEEPDETGPSIKGTSKRQGGSGGALRLPNEVVGAMAVMNAKLDGAMPASGTERIILMDSIVLVLSACITPTKLAKHGSAQSKAACSIFATNLTCPGPSALSPRAVNTGRAFFVSFPAGWNGKCFFLTWEV